jgi:DNA ligase-4
LKKDYIPGLGDSVDLVVVGGRRDPAVAGALGEGNWSWTTFYLACIDNKRAGQNERQKPVFRIVCAVSQPAISIQDLRFLIQYGTPFQVPFADNGINVEVKSELTDGQPPTTLFTRPAVVEAVGAGFDRLPNSRLETLRFPRITKVHHDRGFLDAIDFDSYQQMARQHRTAKQDGIEIARDDWLRRLALGDSDGDLDLQISTQATRETTPTTSSNDLESYLGEGVERDETCYPAHGHNKRAASDVCLGSDCKNLGSSELPAPVSRSISALRRLTAVHDGPQSTPPVVAVLHHRHHASLTSDQTPEERSTPALGEGCRQTA